MPKIRHYDISHFRAPYKNATVQGYDGVGAYDFISAASPPLEGLSGAETAPSAIVDMLAQNFWPYYASPSMVYDLIEQIQQPIGAYTKISTRIYSVFISMWQYGGTWNDAQAMIQYTINWIQNQWSKVASQDELFVQGSALKSAMNALAMKAAIERGKFSVVAPATLWGSSQVYQPFTSAVASRPSTSASLTPSTVYAPVASASASLPGKVAYVPGGFLAPKGPSVSPMPGSKAPSPLPVFPYLPPKPVKKPVPLKPAAKPSSLPVFPYLPPRPVAKPMPRLPLTPVQAPVPIVTVPRPSFTQIPTKPAPLPVFPYIPPRPVVKPMPRLPLTPVQPVIPLLPIRPVAVQPPPPAPPTIYPDGQIPADWIGSKDADIMAQAKKDAADRAAAADAAAAQDASTLPSWALPAAAALGVGAVVAYVIYKK